MDRILLARREIDSRGTFFYAARLHGIHTERERLKIIVNTCSKRRVTDICCVERSRWSRVACEPASQAYAFTTPPAEQH
jgi:hypothetical protein